MRELAAVVATVAAAVAVSVAAALSKVLLADKVDKVAEASEEKCVLDPKGQ